ncbi:MAG TPA: carbohydrate ABC transporter permease [Roseiflexaceae bacterium]|nr:carbohydrate ABC transporter permease [Roseiflexaceae bacterium]
MFNSKLTTSDTQLETQSAKLKTQHAKLSAARLAGYAACLLAVLAIGAPVYWILIAAFKTSREIYAVPPTWLPLQPTLANFPAAWEAAPFGRYYVNSIVTTLLGSACEVWFALSSAYALAFLRFPGKHWLFVLLLAALMVPEEITIIPNYLTVARLGWIDSYQGIVVPGASIAFGTFLLRQAFLSLPHEVLDAAKVDGAGHLRTLFSVVTPLALPSVATMALLSVVAKWNEFLWPLIVTNTQAMRTLPIGLSWLLDQEGTTEWGVVMAGTLFVIIPMVLAFLWAQRFVVEGIAAGAVKG